MKKFKIFYISNDKACETFVYAADAKSALCAFNYRCQQTGLTATDSKVVEW